MSKIAITAPFFPDLVARLRSEGHEVVVRDDPGPMPREELLDRAADAEALICLLSDRIDAELFERGKRLRLVANVAVGYENVDLDAARALGIRVTNTPGVLTETTADLTFGLLLAVARRIAAGDTAVRAGRFPLWGLTQPLLGCDVHGKTLGILGMGRIGTAVARRARAGFAMTILYHNRGRNPEAEREFDATWVPFDRLLRESDFVSIHAPATPETEHLFDATAFAAMKPSAMLINVGRGSIVDEAALVAALERGLLAGAALDVYEREPDVSDGLLQLGERVVLTPHLGSATHETRHAMAELAVRNVIAVLAGRPPATPVV